MMWRTKKTTLNGEEVFKYSSARLIVVSTIELSKESLNRIHNIIKKEKSSCCTILRIASELEENVEGVLFDYEPYGILKRFYIEINTKRVYQMDMIV